MSDVLHDLQGEVLAENLQRENDEIDVVEEIQVDVPDIEDNRLRPVPQDHSHLGYTLAPVGAQR
jgi:hypothetical protein